MRKSTYGLLCACLLPCVAYAQTRDNRTNKGFFNITQLGYHWGIGSYGVDFDKRENDGRVYRLRTTFGYFVTPQVSVGVGFGLDGLHNPSFNTAPLVADVRYYLFDDRSGPYAGATLGYAPEWGGAFTAAPLGSVTLGYRQYLGKRFSFLTGLSYDAHQVRGVWFRQFDPQFGFRTIKANFWLQSFSLSGSLFF